ncbi:hypothetical protein [Cellulomonas sp. ATA003]|uniref:hypothetical protein n=1 Tax=Cellulomonas sp. ATA003 TaxID=3073064 RepID=UPI002872B1A6|nr:hypothetical protein [Cellulomonas sp. ATA003]WNB84626.1 hypothetical protein REH70_12505 [Cellulomonas sp. ATA003]
MSTASEWFRPASPRVAADDLFLVRARTLAPALLAPLVEPRDTGARPARWIGDEPGVVLTVDVPGCDPEHLRLQVTFAAGRLSGRWVDGLPLSEHGAEAGPDLLVADVAAGQDAGAADLALHWLSGQLTRPVREERWVGWRGTIASRLVMADTGSVLLERGGRVIRRHAEPTQVLQVRPCVPVEHLPGGRPGQA